MRALAALSSLGSLHLGGAVALGEAGCAALAASLGGRLTSLQLSSCASLADPALFRLAPLAPGLRRLGLCSCEGVTDIGLAALLRGAIRWAAAAASPARRWCCEAKLWGGLLQEEVQRAGRGRATRAAGRCTWLPVADAPPSARCCLSAPLPRARRLSHLELAGCHRNITGIGLQVGGLRRLRHLDLAGCDAITGEAPRGRQGCREGTH